jgi:TPR repeat protein
MAYDMIATDVQTLNTHFSADVSELAPSETTIAETHLFELGLSHATGVGAELDYVEAHKWFNIAALRGNLAAKERRQELTTIMTQSQVSAAQRAAREWLLRAAN